MLHCEQSQLGVFITCAFTDHTSWIIHAYLLGFVAESIKAYFEEGINGRLLAEGVKFPETNEKSQPRAETSCNHYAGQGTAKLRHHRRGKCATRIITFE
jgi:hypothetical protein